MKKKSYIRISPDIDCLYIDSEGCCYSAYDDEIYNEDPKLGPRFYIVIPGIKEWLQRYEDATDFVETETAPDFDWKTWHYEGLCFAKAIREQLPRCIKLRYEPPFEDKSNTIGSVEVDEHIEEMIEKLQKSCSQVVHPVSIKDNVGFNIEKRDQFIVVQFKVGRLAQQISIPINRLDGIRNWLKGIIGGSEIKTIQLPEYQLHFFRQTVGFHLEMGVFRMERSMHHDPSFQAYVNIREFVKGFYLSLMTEIGFGLYDDIGQYPSGEEKTAKWAPYNTLKSKEIEHFIFGLPPAEEESHRIRVDETFTMFPEYGGCIFWDCMGVGSGEYDELHTDNGSITIDVPGLKKWAECYDNHDDSQSFEAYWCKGLELAKKVRRLLPDNIDLYYMCYDPKQPDAIIDYNCWLPRIIVPRQGDTSPDKG